MELITITKIRRGKHKYITRVSISRKNNLRSDFQQKLSSAHKTVPFEQQRTGTKEECDDTKPCSKCDGKNLDVRERYNEVQGVH